MRAEELKKLIDSNQIIVIDVRTTPEYNEGHIPGAISIPLDKLEQSIKQYSKTDPIAVYCLSGARAQSATWLLENLGYRKITNFGGVVNWPYQLKK